MTTSRPRTAWAPYFFLAPFLLIFCAFALYPLFQSLILSMQTTHGPTGGRFVGLQNYQSMFADPLFWHALQNTCFFALGSLLTQMPLALILALLLNRKNLRGRAIYRLIFFAPSLMGLVFVAVLVGLFFAKHSGLVNIWLHGLFGWDIDYAWLDEHVRPTLVLAALWVFTGFNMVYFLAALQNVDPELLEAAQVDGASPLHRFWHITLPSIRPVASFIALLSVLGSFQIFELPYVIFISTDNENGPRDQGLTVVMYLYKHAFELGDIGFASAVGWVLAILLMFVAIAYRLLTRAEEA